MNLCNNQENLIKAVSEILKNSTVEVFPNPRDTALIYEMPITTLKDYDKYYVDEIQSYVFVWLDRGDMSHEKVQSNLPKEITKNVDSDKCYVCALEYYRDELHPYYPHNASNEIIEYVFWKFYKENYNVDINTF